MPAEETGTELEGDEDLPQGVLCIVADRDYVPKGAKPLKCAIECTGAKEPLIRVDGTSTGPFKLSMSDELIRINRESANGTTCLLEMLKVHVKQMDGYLYQPREPSPLAERVAELGGCELQRLVERPVVLGFFQLVFPPPCTFTLKTSCCTRGFCGAKVSLLNHSADTFDESGLVQLKRKRELFKDSCDLVAQVDQVPPCLLPGGSMRFAASCHPLDSIAMDFSISCLIFIYWTAPDEEDASMEDGDEPPEAQVWMAADIEHLPTEIQPIEGVLSCPGAMTEEYILDGTDAGPFHVMRPKPRVSSGTPEDPCLLSRIRCTVTTPPPGYEFRPRNPAPHSERCAELGGCELHRLTGCPMVIGYLKPIPPPPLQLSIRTTCCDRYFFGARIAHDGKDPVCVEDENGFVTFDRKRDKGTQEIEILDVPKIYLPDQQTQLCIECSPYEEMHVSLDVICKLWVYWVPPEEEEPAEDEESDVEPLEGMLFVAADPEMIPDEALPLACSFNCKGLETPTMKLDGTSMGPFDIIAEERRPFPTASSPAPFINCILANIRFSVLTPPEGFHWRQRMPSPLMERCEEIGGCELGRLMKCPQVMGYFKPFDKSCYTEKKNKQPSEDEPAAEEAAPEASEAEA